jgi:hypothetical protein
LQVLSIELSGRPSQSLSCAERQSRDAGSTAPSHVENAPPTHVLKPI